MTNLRLYNLGNIAKTLIVNDILASTQGVPGEEVLVFDYGCGGGGDWPSILSEHPRLKYIGHDPCQKSLDTARVRMRGLNAEFVSGDELMALTFKAPFIVSLSVFEHVYDRRAYLRKAKQHLETGGKFYLNYDDGHFRNMLNLNLPGTWIRTLRAWLKNLLAEPLASVGRVAGYQRSVNRGELTALITDTELRVEKVFYSNLESLKGLQKTIPDEKQAEYSRMWMKLEEELNQCFFKDGVSMLGKDASNLWQVMGSRTLVLMHD